MTLHEWEITIVSLLIGFVAQLFVPESRALIGRTWQWRVFLSKRRAAKKAKFRFALLMIISKSSSSAVGYFGQGMSLVVLNILTAVPCAWVGTRPESTMPSWVNAGLVAGAAALVFLSVRLLVQMMEVGLALIRPEVELEKLISIVDAVEGNSEPMTK